jgi:hypothetical protein
MLSTALTMKDVEFLTLAVELVASLLIFLDIKSIISWKRVRHAAQNL